MTERLGDIKKRLIEAACPATFEELQTVGMFHTKGGLWNFLKRNKAKQKKLLIIEFPVGE